MKKKYWYFVWIVFLAANCTKLEEKTDGSLTSVQVQGKSATELLRGVYGSLEFTFTSYQEVFALSDISTDEAIVPTRGNNWDDNGSWRVMHEQKWDADNVHLHDCFHSLESVVFAGTDILRFHPDKQQQAEARFLRAWAMYWILDFFDQVPYRDTSENIVLPARVRKGTEALNYIIDEINAVAGDLPTTDAGTANQYAAKVLLMKCYLNKGVYANRIDPSFDVADMNKVIALADQIISSNKYTLSNNYFDNFSPENSTIGKENIFTQKSNADGNYQLAFAWQAILHYSQNGFNGFTTLPDFYGKFEAGDKRRGIAYSYPNAPANPGNRVNVGFLSGQQYDLNSDDPIVFYTPEVANIEPGPDLESPGIRPIKYAPDYLNYFVFGSPPTNDFVYLRFPDVLLMKAEAILRGGTGTSSGTFGNTALSIVNALRTHPSRAASSLSNINLNDILDERGRELWWENWRRQDLVRFKRYILPFQEKNYTSDPKYLLFPIPNEQLAVNKYLSQNPGY